MPEIKPHVYFGDDGTIYIEFIHQPEKDDPNDVSGRARFAILLGATEEDCSWYMVSTRPNSDFVGDELPEDIVNAWLKYREIVGSHGKV